MRLLAAVLAAAALGAAAVPAGARPKDDVIRLDNGDDVTGEIKELQRAQLKYSTDHMGTVYVEWNEVLRVQSRFYYRIRLGGGSVITGRFLESGVDHVLRIAGVDTLIVSTADVVEIDPLEQSFWAGLDGSLSLGASYTKASDVGQLSFDFTSYYQTVRNHWQLTASSITTAEKDEAPSNNQDISFSLDRDTKRKTWFLGASAQAQRNDQLGLNLRLLFSLTTGIRPVDTNHNQLSARSGLSVNREWSTDTQGDSYNVEGLIGANYSVFRYNSPKTDITTTLAVYPNLSTWGRVRAEFDLTGNHELVSDFFVSLSVYDSYDSDPPSQETGNNDYGVVLSIGWTY